MLSKKLLVFIKILLLLVCANVYAEKAVVIFKSSGCFDYFVAQSDSGYLLLQWYGGYDPSAGDVLVGDISSYGLKSVYYPQQDVEGEIYVDDYGLLQARIIEKVAEKCD